MDCVHSHCFDRFFFMTNYYNIISFITGDSFKGDGQRRITVVDEIKNLRDESLMMEFGR